MKLSKDHELEPTLTLTQPKNMYKKDRKIAWSVSSVSSKALIFLFHHKDQKKHNEVAFHAFFLVFPTKEPHQLSKESLIEKGMTHMCPRVPYQVIMCHRVSWTWPCPRLMHIASRLCNQLINHLASTTQPTSDLCHALLMASCLCSYALPKLLHTRVCASLHGALHLSVESLYVHWVGPRCVIAHTLGLPPIETTTPSLKRILSYFQFIRRRH